MLGKPQDARHRGVSWAGTWGPGGRMSAVRGAALAQLADRRP